MHLERLLQSQGFGTRRDCRAMIRQGRIALSGSVVDDPYLDIAPVPGLVFAVDAQPWPWLEHAVLAMNKPAGHECSRKPKDYPDVTTLLPPPLRARGVQPVGRLDADTTGLLILTDDGQLNHQLSSPKRKLPKVYEARCKHPLTPDMLAALCAGVVLHDDPEPVRADAAEAVEPTLLRLTLVQGKYHQVKRMLAAVGNRVDALTRVAIGGYVLPPDLPPGAWRFLSEADLALLRTAP